MKTIIYLHGFNSSSHSEKAQLTKFFFNEAAQAFKLHIPQLPSEPKMAIKKLHELIESLGPEAVAGFIGSSLGAYYSLFLHQLYGLPAVLINPALKPYELLSGYLGENMNPYTGEKYRVEVEHMQQLKSLEVPNSANPKNLYLLTQTGDEVLDYREALLELSGVQAWIVSGGDHAFQTYRDVLPSILAFFERRCL